MSAKTTDQKKIVFVFGEGGHHAEMDNLIKQIDFDQCNDISFVAMTDVSENIHWASETVMLKEVRDKQSSAKALLVFQNLVQNTVKCVRFLKQNKVSLVVSTGPGKAIAPAIAAKFLGIKVLHVESCARFITKSLTGRVMYFLSDEFWVQNESLTKLYPKSKFVGLL